MPKEHREYYLRSQSELGVRNAIGLRDCVAWQRSAAMEESMRSRKDTALTDAWSVAHHERHAPMSTRTSPPAPSPVAKELPLGKFDSSVAWIALASGVS